MAALQCNISKGREVEFYERVNTNDPTNSVLVVAVLADPCEPLATLQDYDTLAAMIAANPEVTNTNYARIILTDADLATAPVDDTNNRRILSLPLMDWSSPAPSAGDNWAVGVIGYDSDSTGGTDANIIPISVFDFVEQGVIVIPDGGSIFLDFTDGWLAAV
jgi:hypothetical protein